MIEANLSAKLAWDRGVILFNTALDTPISLPTALSVPKWKVKLLKSLLRGQYYALIQVLSGKEMEIITLRSQNDLPLAPISLSAPSSYPPLIG